MSDKKPRVNAEGQRELEKVETQLDNFNDSMQEAKEKSRTLVSQETEPQTKIAQADMAKSDVIYLKPKRTFPSSEKFNEKFRDDYNYEREYVEFIAENNEIKGESIDFCIKKFPGVPVEEWVVPVNKPISAPRYVKERIQECGYTIFTTIDAPVGSETGVTYYGQMVAEQRRDRLIARDYVKKPRIFTGARLVI